MWERIESRERWRDRAVAAHSEAAQALALPGVPLTGYVVAYLSGLARLDRARCRSPASGQPHGPSEPLNVGSGGRPATPAAAPRIWHLDLYAAQACVHALPAGWGALLSRATGEGKSAAGEDLAPCNGASSHLLERGAARLFLQMARRGPETCTLGRYLGTYPVQRLLLCAGRHDESDDRRLLTRQPHGRRRRVTPPPTVNAPEDSTSSGVLERAVGAAVRALPAETRLCLYLRFARGHSLAAIAAELKVQEPAVCKRLKRGIERLRAALDEPGPGVGQPEPSWRTACAALLCRSLELDHVLHGSK